jgi:hypothetical protein
MCGDCVDTAMAYAIADRCRREANGDDNLAHALAERYASHDPTLSATVHMRLIDRWLEDLMK